MKNWSSTDTIKREQTMPKQTSEWVGKVRKLMVDYIRLLIKRFQGYVIRMCYKVNLGAKRGKEKFLE